MTIGVRLVFATALCLVLVGPSFAASGQATAPSSAQVLEESELYFPSLSLDFLDPQMPVRSITATPGKPVRDLLVGHYDVQDGLFAGYEASNGVRLLFKSEFTSEQTVSVRVLYRDTANGQVKPVVTLAKLPSDGTGPGRVSLSVGGVDILALLEQSARIRGLDLPEERQLKAFLRTDVGQALVEFVPVLFVKLEVFDADNLKLSGLKVPFGMVRMAIDLVSGQYGGFRNADRSLGKEKADQLRAACDMPNCQFKSEQFVIHHSGLFDIVSDLNREHSGGSVKSTSQLPSRDCSTSTVGLLGEVSENLCEGLCGLGCFAPFAISTEECVSHDQCVDDLQSHLACLFDPDGYSNLFSAAWSYFTALLFGQDGNESGGGGVPPVPGVNGYYTPDMIGMTFCTFDIKCIDYTSGL